MQTPETQEETTAVTETEDCTTSVETVTETEVVTAIDDLEQTTPVTEPLPETMTLEEAVNTLEEQQQADLALRAEKIKKMNQQVAALLEDNDPELIQVLAATIGNVLLHTTNFSQQVANSVQNAIVYHNHQQSQAEMVNICISREAMDGPNLRVQYVERSDDTNVGFMGYVFNVFASANERETTVSSFSHPVELRPLVCAHLVKQFQLLNAQKNEVFSAYYSVSAMSPTKVMERLANGTIAEPMVKDPVEVNE